MSTPTPILTLNNIEVIYDRVALAIKGVSVEVPQGGMVALLGANGAGKSTTLKSISGLLKAERIVSGDKYIFVRNAYLQNREFRVQDGQVEDDF